MDPDCRGRLRARWGDLGRERLPRWISPIHAGPEFGWASSVGRSTTSRLSRSHSLPGAAPRSCAARSWLTGLRAGSTPRRTCQPMSWKDLGRQNGQSAERAPRVGDFIAYGQHAVAHSLPANVSLFAEIGTVGCLASAESQGHPGLRRRASDVHRPGREREAELVLGDSDLRVRGLGKGVARAADIAAADDRGRAGVALPNTGRGMFPVALTVWGAALRFWGCHQIPGPLVLARLLILPGSPHR